MYLCVDQKDNFSDTHGHFCPATGISRTVPVVCKIFASLELYKSNIEKQTLGFAAYAIAVSDKGTPKLIILIPLFRFSGKK